METLYLGYRYNINISLLCVLIPLMDVSVQVLKYNPINKCCSIVIISLQINLMETGAESRVDISHGVVL